MSLENKLQKAINSKKPEKIEIVFEEIYYEYGKLVGFIISKYISKKRRYRRISRWCIYIFF